MHPQIEALFDEAENRYLKPEELKTISQYVESLPGRLEAYRALRDHELEVMQWVADQLQLEMPQEKVENLERCIKNALLMLRHCSMAMLLNDETLVKERLLNWISQTTQLYDTRAIDMSLYRLLNQRLTQVLGTKHINYLAPSLKLAQTAMVSPTAAMNGAAVR